MNRREFFKLTFSTAPLISSCVAVQKHHEGLSPFASTVVDSSVNLAGGAEAMQSCGVKTVFRYYSLPQPGFAQKIITRSELDALLNAGLSVAVIWQWYSQHIDNFKPEHAKLVSSECLKFATQMDQPSGSAIYFGVDGNLATNHSNNRIIIHYFEHMRRTIGPAGYRIGVYGSGRVCEMLGNAELADFFWLPKSMGWQGTRAFYGSGKWHLYQNIHEHPIPGTIKPVDFNVLNPNTKDFGQWSKKGIGKGHTLAENRAVFNSYRFPLVVRLVLRANPDDHAPVTAVLPGAKYRSVKVLKEEADWVQVYFGDEFQGEGFKSGRGWARRSEISVDYRVMPT